MIAPVHDSIHVPARFLKQIVWNATMRQPVRFAICNYTRATLCGFKLTDKTIVASVVLGSGGRRNDPHIQLVEISQVTAADCVIVEKTQSFVAIEIVYFIAMGGGWRVYRSDHLFVVFCDCLFDGKH